MESRSQIREDRATWGQNTGYILPRQFGVTEIREVKIKPSFRANIWLVAGRDRNLLVDSGFGIVSLRQNLRSLFNKSTIAVATHSHCDHIGGHYEFENTAIHENEASILREPTVENTIAKGYVSRNMFCNVEDAGDFDPAAFFIRGVEPTRILKHGDIIDLGDRKFEVVHLPGHSPGGIGLLETSTAFCSRGDMVHNGPDGIGRYALYHSNSDDWLNSVRILKELDVSIVYPGHFNPFGQERFNEILDEYISRKA